MFPIDFTQNLQVQMAESLHGQFDGHRISDHCGKLSPMCPRAEKKLVLSTTYYFQLTL